MLSVALSSADIAVAEPSYMLSDGVFVETLEKFQECDVCPEMIVLPMGTFTMGAPREESAQIDFRSNLPPGEQRGLASEGPPHEVEIDIPIAMGRNEVTHDEWMLCVADAACSHTPGRIVLADGGRREVVGRSPVIYVTYLDMLEYVDWVNSKLGISAYRLPTEAEWEFGARAGTNTRFAQGDTLTKEQANFRTYRVESYTGYLDPDPTDHKIPISVDELDAANGWGLRHMSGNVLEFTMSCTSPRHLGLAYSSEYLTVAETESPCDRIVKGGAYTAASVSARPANRGHGSEDRRSDVVGFRLVRELR